MLRRLVAVAAILASLTIATPAHAATTRPSTITVHRGDTLIRLASRYCGHGSAYRSLAVGNHLANPNRIYTGQRLRLTCSHTPLAMRQRGHSAAATTARNARTASSRIRTVIAYAMAQRGDPYRFGAAGPNAFDCSGLVVASYARIGIHLPHQTGALLGRGVRVSRANLRIGDLVFLSPSHVAIYIGGDKVVVAPQPGERVKTQAIYAFFTARRVIK